MTYVDYSTPRVEIDSTRQLELMHSRGTPRRMTSHEYLSFVEELFSSMEELIAKKNADYTNGAGPFANFEAAKEFGVDPLISLMVRLNDKVQRLKSFAKQGSLNNESVEDAFKDLIGYSCLALGMLEERRRD